MVVFRFRCVLGLARHWMNSSCARFATRWSKWCPWTICRRDSPRTCPERWPFTIPWRERDVMCFLKCRKRLSSSFPADFYQLRAETTLQTWRDSDKPKRSGKFPEIDLTEKNRATGKYCFRKPRLVSVSFIFWPFAFVQMIALPPDMAANGHGGEGAQRIPPPMVDFCSGANYEALHHGKLTLNLNFNKRI